MTQTERSFEGYDYRTSSHFGSWTKIIVEGDVVSITGPRVGVVPYRLWVALQALLEMLTLAALLAAVVLRDWRYALLAPALLVTYLLVGMIGAAGMWELANMMAKGSGHPAHTFTVDSVKRVKIGPGWARYGLSLVILPYVAGINKMSEGHAVSFEAPGVPISHAYRGRGHRARAAGRRRVTVEAVPGFTAI